MSVRVPRYAPTPEGEVLEVWAEFGNAVEEAKGAVGGECGDVATDQAHHWTWAAVQGLERCHLARKDLVDLLVCLIVELCLEHCQLGR